MLYQLSYASGAVAREKASAKIGVDRGSVKIPIGHLADPVGWNGL